jgi:hypothetical protein
VTRQIIIVFNYHDLLTFSKNKNESMIFSDKFNDEIHDFKRYITRDVNKDALVIQLITIHSKTPRNHRGYYIVIPTKHTRGEYDYAFNWICYDTNRIAFDNILNEMSTGKPLVKEKVLKEMEKEEKDAGVFFFTLLIEDKDTMPNAASMLFYIHDIVEQKKNLLLSLAAMLLQSLLGDEINEIFSGDDAEYFNEKENGT